MKVGLGLSLTRQRILGGDFSPSDISNLDLWYDFSTISGSDGDAVSSFANGGNAGSDYNLSQGTAGRRPLLETGDMALNSVKFDNNDDRLSLDNVYVTTDQTFTFFVVFETGQAGTDILMGGDNTVNNENFISLAGAHGVAIQTRFKGVTGGANNDTVTTKTDGTESGGTNGDVSYTFRENIPEIMVMTRASDEEMRFYNHNGALICTEDSATNNNANTNFRVQTIGTDGGGSGAHQGTIGEIGLYNKVLTSTEISDLITHLKDKWSVS